MILRHATNSLTVGKSLNGKHKSAFRCELTADANLMKLLRAVMRLVGDGPTKESGFTLIELMVTVSCIIVIAAIGAPRLKGYLLQANLVEAKSYLAEIAEKERLYKITTGRYCCTNYDNSNEQKLSDGLGLSLSDANNFCFVFICNSSTLCESPKLTPSFIVPGDPASPAIEFEVWAIVLDPSSTNNVQGPGNISCNPLATKTAPTGWAKPGSATSSAGRAGQVVVLRYPPPANGLSVSMGTYHNIQFTWTDGISVSDAMFP